MEFFRVQQLDAQLLDSFYQEKILETVLKGFQFDHFKRFLASALVKTLYLYSGLWKNGVTEGNTIYNVLFDVKDKKLLVFHYLAEIFQIFYENFQDQLGILGIFWNFFSLFNWVLFLVKGDFRSFPERLGRIRMKLKNHKKPLNIDYFYTKRAIFFNVLSDTAKVILPQIQFGRILQFFNSEANLLAETGDACVVCGDEEIVSPCKFERCVHSACYYCFVGCGRVCEQCR